jgi:hypothetical protein
MKLKYENENFLYGLDFLYSQMTIFKRAAFLELGLVSLSTFNLGFLPIIVYMSSHLKFTDKRSIQEK